MFGQAERKQAASTLKPDADNAVVGSRENWIFYKEVTATGFSCFCFSGKEEMGSVANHGGLRGSALGLYSSDGKPCSGVRGCQ